MNDEDVQLQLALQLSREENLRRTLAQQEEDDFNSALQVQHEELTRTQNERKRGRVARVFDAIASCLIGPSRVCGSCQNRIHNDSFLTNGSHFHPQCYRGPANDNCYVCHRPLPWIGNRVTWSEHPFWRRRFCPCHNEDGTPRCSACERLRPVDQRWIVLSDGREICSECFSTMIVDTFECQPLYTNVLELYRFLELLIPVRPPLMLVDRQALNERSCLPGHVGEPQTRGMTLAEEYRSVRTVYSRRGPFYGQLTDSYPEEHRECRVTAILILFGLPRLLTGSILAHECMHAYLKMHNVTQLTPIVEEGLCQLMAYLWIEHQTPEDTYEKRLASFIANQIRTHPSPAYGDGFRLALSAYQTYGLPNLIQQVKQTGGFPEPLR